MTLEQLAVAFYTFLLALSRRTRRQARARYAELNRAQLLVSWNSIVGPAVLAEVTTAQLAAANAGARYAEAAVALQGGARSTFAVPPAAFAGISSDGGELPSLLIQPVLQALKYLADGVDEDSALARGAFALDTIVSTQVADAGRESTETAQTANRAIKGYTRMLTLPSCGRCAILAGRFYRWSEGFERHPGCDCVHVPAVEAEGVNDLRTDPKAYFDSLSQADQRKYFGAGEAEAIRLGGDMGRVVNSARNRGGLSKPGRRRGGRPRPGELIESANGDRDAAIRLLRENGFIIA